MTEPTTLPAAPGRSPSRRGAVHDTVRTHLARGGGVLLTGPAGIGRTTVAHQLVADLRRPGSPDPALLPLPRRKNTPFLGLIDLLADLGDDALAALAAHERAALEGALLRSAPRAGTGRGAEAGPEGDREALVLRIAVRKVVALLCGTGPFLLVVDDTQWLDRPTADVLNYLARRAGPGLSVLATLRSGDGVRALPRRPERGQRTRAVRAAGPPGARPAHDRP